MKNDVVEKYDQERHRVVCLLNEYERIRLKVLARQSGRSMSGYIRYLISEEIENRFGR